MLNNLFQGRLSRFEFLMRYFLCLFVFIISVVVLNYVSNASISVKDSYMLVFLFLFLVTFIYQLSIYVRRLRDSGQPMLLLLLLLIIPLSFLLFLYLLFVPSKENGSANQISSENKTIANVSGSTTPK